MKKKITEIKSIYPRWENYCHIRVYIIECRVQQYNTVLYTNCLKILIPSIDETRRRVINWRLLMYTDTQTTQNISGWTGVKSR